MVPEVTLNMLIELTASSYIFNKSEAYIRSQVAVLKKNANQLENTEQEGPYPLSYSTDMTWISNNTAFKACFFYFLHYQTYLRPQCGKRPTSKSTTLISLQ